MKCSKGNNRNNTFLTFVEYLWNEYDLRHLSFHPVLMDDHKSTTVRDSELDIPGYCFALNVSKERESMKRQFFPVLTMQSPLNSQKEGTPDPMLDSAPSGGGGDTRSLKESVGVVEEVQLMKRLLELQANQIAALEKQLVQQVHLLLLFAPVCLLALTLLRP